MGGAVSSMTARGPPRVAPTSRTMPTSVAAAMASASRIGRRGVESPAYLRVAVPVIFEWIVHTNVYDPAGSAGTS